jgi:hypothetical protein
MYRDFDTAAGRVRVTWPKRLFGRRPTKAESAAYWRARGVMDMAKQSQKVEQGFKKVANDLNLWPADDNPAKGAQLVALVTAVKLDGPFGLQVKVCDPKGTVFTLASHKVLQGRLESVPGGLRPMQTILRITYTGKEKAKKWPTPMMMYDVEYADRVKDGMIDLFADVVPAEQTF